jgi:hypothetical protein
VPLTGTSTGTDTTPTFLGLDVRGAAVSMKCTEGTVRALTAQAIGELRSSGLDVDEEI